MTSDRTISFTDDRFVNCETFTELNIRISIIVAKPSQSGCTSTEGTSVLLFQTISYFPWTCCFQEIRIQQPETTRSEKLCVRVCRFFPEMIGDALAEKGVFSLHEKCLNLNQPHPVSSC